MCLRLVMPSVHQKIARLRRSSVFRIPAKLLVKIFNFDKSIRSTDSEADVNRLKEVVRKRHAL